jgi:hypothetical protein
MGFTDFFRSRLRRGANETAPDLRGSSAERVTAVYRLTDQLLLAYVAQNDPESDVRSAAVWMITDRSLLARIAKNDAHPGVRQAARIKSALFGED